VTNGQAGAHVSVLLAEAVEALAIRSDGVYVDGTFGRGGHSRAILEQLGPQGRLIAFDRDPTAIAAGAAIADKRFTLVHAAFSEMADVLAGLNVAAVDGVLLDIGVSSPQLDDASRGMSFRFDAPLDMRMDTTKGETAAEFLAQASQREIERVVRDYGEERFRLYGRVARRLFVIAYTRRETLTRIISARKANARERDRYGAD